MTRLEELRGCRSQRQIATSLGISAAHYSYIEKSERVPSLLIAYRMAEYFRVPIAELFCLEGGNIQLTDTTRRQHEHS